MSERQKHTPNTHALLVAIAVTVVAIALGVFAFLRYYDSYIDRVLYQERLNQMKEVTTQLFNGLEDVVVGRWKDVDAFCNYVENGKPANDETLLTFMQKLAILNNLESDGINLVAVDNMGRYLTQDGWQGTLDEMDYLLSEPEKVSFVSKSMISDESRMYFLKRLPEPVEMDEGGRKIQVIYYGISQIMTALNPYFNCSAYDNSNSVYVLNESGMRLFYGSNNNLVKGYNAYTVLQKMEYLHDSSFDEAKADLEKNGYGYANAVMNGEEYYYALYQMNGAEWVLLFLVPSRYVAMNTVDLVNMTVRMVLIFAVVMLAVSIASVIWLMKRQQKMALDVERRNSAKLEHLNIQLQAASKAKTDFLANMSHDIRTPMNAIVGITKLMAHDKTDPEKIGVYINKIQQSSQHLLSLINDVLDMSKIESNEVTLNVEPIGLANQISQVESIVRPQIEERKQHFTVRTKNVTHEHLVGDAVRLRQILINLLSNAVKYTPNGGEICLELEELSSKDANHAAIRIVVSDSGYGMTQEFMKHIFEPFTRAENSTTNRVQGTGLGMAITKNIVDLAGGTISVESELNKGSRFTVELPLLIDPDAKTILPAQNVLLVTDDEGFVENAQAAFKASDATLLVARTDAEVDRLLHEHAMDVILLGRDLGDNTLANNVQRLRQNAGKALLFYCCGYDERDHLPAVSEKGGVDGVLARPFFLSNLAAAIDRVKNSAPAAEEESDSYLKGKRFLCAEDNSLNAEILQAVLDMNGASCVIYSNGQKIVEAFASVKPGEYDAILMDVQMPVMNGLDATREIRRSENPLGKTIPIIAMTANAFSEDVQNCLNAGMDAHVPKPLDIATLERALKSVASGKFSGGGSTVRQ